MRHVSLEDLKSFAGQLKATFRLEGLVQGNYSKEQALEVARNLKKTLQSSQPAEGSLAPIRIRQVPSGEHCCRLASFHPTDSNSVVVNYYQVGATNLHQTAVMEILVVSWLPGCVSSKTLIFLTFGVFNLNNLFILFVEFDGRAGV